MSKVYECTLTKTMTFNIRADSEEDVQWWLQTHDLSDVEKETAMYDVGYAQSIHGIVDEEAGIDISEEDFDNE